MTKVKSISILSSDATEAEVIISDGQFELLCFSHPLNYEIGDNVDGTIYSLGTTNIRRSSSTTFEVNQLNGAFDHYIVAKIKDVASGTVVVGEICISIDVELPKDLMTEEFVSFACERLDLF